MELFVTGRRADAAEARAWGFVDEIIEMDDVSAVPTRSELWATRFNERLAYSFVIARRLSVPAKRLRTAPAG